MRTFPSFDSGDREHRLIYDEESGSPESAAPTAEKVDYGEFDMGPKDTLETGAEVESTASESVEAAGTLSTDANTTVDTVDVTAQEADVTADLAKNPDVAAAAENVQAAIDQSSTGSDLGKHLEDMNELPKASDETKVDALAQTEAPKEQNTGKTDTATETKEAGNPRYEKAKEEQLQSRENKKYDEASSTNWQTVEHGIVDASGQPFVYKQSDMTNAQGEKVPALIAYSPRGGFQVMDKTTGKWETMNTMSPEKKAQFSAEANTIQKEHASVIAKEKEGEKYNERVDQNTNNGNVEKKCLKSPDGTVQWFERNKGDAMWKKNEDVRDALDASLKPETQPAQNNPLTTDMEVPPAPEDADSIAPFNPAPKAARAEALAPNAPSEINVVPPEPEPTPEQVAGTDTNEKPGEGSGGAADHEKEEGKPEESGSGEAGLEGKATPGTEEKPGEGSGEAADEKKNEEKEAALKEAEKVLENPDATPAQRAEAIKALTAAKLDELDSEDAKKEQKEEKDSDAEAGKEKPKEIDRLKEREETEKEQRSRLHAEVRNPEPMKTVDGVKEEKNKVFSEVQNESNKKIDTLEQDMDSKRGTVDAIQVKLRDAKQAEANGEKGAKENIQKLESELSSAKETLTVAEKNLETLRSNLTILRVQKEKDVSMLDTLDTETKDLAKRTETKIDDMAMKLFSAGDEKLGKGIAENVTISDDTSLGLKVEIGAGLQAMIASALPEASRAKFIEGTNTDNPLPVLNGLQQCMAIAKKIEEAKKKKK